MRKIGFMALVLGLFVSMMGATAWAGAVLHIGNPPNAGTYLFGGEVLPISATTTGVLENGNGQPTLNDPLLLILGVANDAGFAAPSLTWTSTLGTSGTGDLGGTATYYGGSWNINTGFAGSFTSSVLHPPPDVYNFIGLDPSGNGSNNFGNWHDADLAVNGIDADFFGIYVYALYGANVISGGETVTVTFGSAIPDGTFVVAYGQDSKGNAYSTPFTEAGLTTQVPEPGAVLLLGTGLLGLVAVRRKFQK